MSSHAARLAVAVEDGATSSLTESARTLATELDIPIASDAADIDLLLWVRSHGLAIGPPGSRTVVTIDFLGGRTGYRRVSAGGKRGPLARALGVHKGIRKIVDATAGLGRDAFQLAAIGCTVTALERCRVLAMMLKHAHARALDRGNAEVRAVLDRLVFAHADAGKFLRNLDKSQRPEAIYLDPMFPLRSATALTKKEMRIVRDLVGDDGDATNLLETARRVATQRVVVKRHPHTDPLAPDLITSHGGTRVRYDLYAPTP